MLWPVLALLTASCESMKDLFGKKSLGRVDEYMVAWALRFFALPFLLPLLFVIDIPTLGSEFWPALVVDGSLNVVAALLYMRALKISDLSLTVPLVTFTPLFLLVTSPLIVGEFPSPYGLAGIALIVAGSYTLNIRQRHAGFLAPMRALLRDRGPRLMLVVAAIFSITANVDKIGVQNSSPLFWSITLSAFMTLSLFPLMLLRSRSGAVELRENLRGLVLIGLFSALTTIFQMTAIQLTLVAYVIAIKRTSAIFSVLLGHLVLREQGLRERLAGATLMVAGVLLITLSS